MLERLAVSDRINVNPPACRIDIQGIVQGVGFRPFVYQMAEAHTLTGFVANTAAGVTIHVEGPATQIASFINALTTEAPPLAHVVSITHRDVAAQSANGFEIVTSRGGEDRSALIAPDVAVCEDCRRELFDPADRRYRYPFINCTNCGPRYTIIEDIPYDRPKTAMRGFPMCADCRREYDDPADRRFHAQPNACPVCGPSVALRDRAGSRVPTEDPVAETVRRIGAGEIAAVKGLGGYHLVVNARDDAAVARLRRRKHRYEKPLAVMVPDVAGARAIGHLSAADADLLTRIQRPIVLVDKAAPEPLAASVAPESCQYGIMLPYTPLHYLLMALADGPLVMTSANLSEEPIAIDNEEAVDRLGDIADCFLEHDRPIYLRSDDSIVRHSDGHPRLIRRSRGYVPVPIVLPEPGPAVLAVGALLKNTVCLTKGPFAFVSQHVGDLENLSTERFFIKTIDHLQRILDLRPEAVACDLHPDYLSTQWAHAQDRWPVIPVQHHHAHIVACMAEHGVREPVIGIACDGSGYGPDGTVWGGEVLWAEPTGYRRMARFAPVPLPGGDAAIQSPWRMALAYMIEHFGDDWGNRAPSFQASLAADKADVVAAMIRRRINAPLTSSLGRLFDAVAALVGLRHRVAFEGQAAIRLEALADSESHGHYPYGWSAGPLRDIEWRGIIEGVAGDVKQQRPVAVISRRFHDTLIALFSDLCKELRDETGLATVALSGGVFQNDRLFSGLGQALNRGGFRVLRHRQIPTNDGGISLGQAVVAMATLTASTEK